MGACASEPTNTPAATPTGGTPVPTFVDPSSSLSGELKILMWSHFVPTHDAWFDRHLVKPVDSGALTKLVAELQKVKT